ncbi:MAG: cupin domain-containing protein [Chloroflexi bacterium]|nr:cupin domain-containing protein [Chloroflexota bacterium]
MNVLNIADATAFERSGLTSRLLLDEATHPESQLAITWVDVQPGARQIPHSHTPEQVYVIVAGTGTMHLDGQTFPVRRGDRVYIPSGAVHGITNTGETLLQYVSAAAPSFDITAAYEAGALRPEHYKP